MPDEAKEITWSWIKEALPSPELSKVTLFSFSPHYPPYLPHRSDYSLLFFTEPYVQEIYQLTNTLSTPMQKQCNLMSLPRVFQDKIPQVLHISLAHYIFEYLSDIFHFLLTSEPYEWCLKRAVMLRQLLTFPSSFRFTMSCS